MFPLRNSLSSTPVHHSSTPSFTINPSRLASIPQHISPPILLTPALSPEQAAIHHHARGAVQGQSLKNYYNGIQAEGIKPDGLTAHTDAQETWAQFTQEHVDTLKSLNDTTASLLDLGYAKKDFYAFSEKFHTALSPTAHENRYHALLEEHSRALENLETLYNTTQDMVRSLEVKIPDHNTAARISQTEHTLLLERPLKFQKKLADRRLIQLDRQQQTFDRFFQKNRDAQSHFLAIEEELHSFDSAAIPNNSKIANFPDHRDIDIRLSDYLAFFPEPSP